MDQATIEIIEFLNRPELDFGIDPTDADTASEPQALRERIATLLVQPPIWVSGDDAERLRQAASAADWGAVSTEFRRRMQVADSFFADGDATNVPRARVIASES